jgi:hypothetical protein
VARGSSGPPRRPPPRPAAAGAQWPAASPEASSRRPGRGHRADMKASPSRLAAHVDYYTRDRPVHETRRQTRTRGRLGSLRMARRRRRHAPTAPSRGELPGFRFAWRLVCHGRSLLARRCDRSVALRARLALGRSGVRARILACTVVQMEAMRISRAEPPLHVRIPHAEPLSRESRRRRRRRLHPCAAAAAAAAGTPVVVQ